MNQFSHNAKFALVIAEAADTPGGREARQNWQDFLATLNRYGWPLEHTKRIHDNTWLIPLDREMHFLGRLLDNGRSGKTLLRILFLDEEPDWIEYPPPTKHQEETPKTALDSPPQ
jgi:hypothetical protein